MKGKKEGRREAGRKCAAEEVEEPEGWAEKEGKEEGGGGRRRRRRGLARKIQQQKERKK